MTSPEHTEYDRLTEGMEFKFSALTFDFLGHCENIIFGEEYTDLRYFCFHYYFDLSYEVVYNKFCVVMERLHRETDERQFPSLKNGFANLLIYLREPKARENDQEYKVHNLKYWRNMVITDSVLQGSRAFQKYLKKEPLI